MFKPISQLKPKFFLKTGHQAYNGTLKSSCLSDPAYQRPARLAAVASSLQLTARNFNGLTHQRAKPLSPGDKTQRGKHPPRYG